MSGALSLIRELFAIYRPGDIAPASLFWRFVWVAFIVSSIIAWTAQYQRAEKLQEQLHKERETSKPNFVLSIEQTVCFYEVTEQMTVALPIVSIINKGADSAVVSWRARYLSPTFDGDMTVVYFINEPVTIDIPGTNPIQKLQLRNADFINNKTAPIPRGGFLSGRLPIAIKGNKTQEIHSGKAKLTICAIDFTGKQTCAEFISKAQAGVRLAYPRGIVR